METVDRRDHCPLMVSMQIGTLREEGGKEERAGVDRDKLVERMRTGRGRREFVPRETHRSFWQQRMVDLARVLHPKVGHSSVP